MKSEGFRDGYIEVAAARLAAAMERGRRDHFPRMLWLTSVGLIEQALSDHGRDWRHWETSPEKHLRGLRRDIAESFNLARFAVTMQVAENAAEWEAHRPMREARDQVDAAKRRDQTMAAELARIAKQRGEKPPSAWGDDHVPYSERELDARPTNPAG